MTNQIHKEIISKLIDFALADQDMRIYITKPKEVDHFTISIAPVTQYYPWYLDKIDTGKMLSFHTKFAPFLGAKQMKARELIPIINKMLQGEDNESAEDIH